MPNVSNEIKGRQSLSSAQMEYIAKDFEIGSHTISHRLLTRIPIDDARYEIVDSRKILQDKYSQKIESFSYPRGYANPDLQKIVQETGYTNARSTLVGYIHESENQFFEQTTVHAGNDRKEYGGKSWYEYALYMLDVAAETPNSVYHVWGHGWELANYPNGLAQFESLLSEIKNKL
jgi:peptidoglycan/xylan/chitin deacetylase (PgdA/CDA1 family)